MKTILLSLLFTCLFYGGSVFSQSLRIRSVDPLYAKAFDTLTIIGQGFGSPVGQLNVFVGGVWARKVLHDNTTIKVLVPVSTSDGSVEVTYTDSGQSAKLSHAFRTTFSGGLFGKEQLSSASLLLSLDNPLLCHRWADIDKDHDSDIAAVYHKGVGNRIVFWQNQYDSLNIGQNPGALYSAVSFKELPAGQVDLAFGDVDNDGSLDILVSICSPADLRIFLLINNTDGGMLSFSDPVLVYSGDGFSARSLLQVGDVNADGYLDIVFVSSVTGLRVLLNDSNNGFTSSSESVFLKNFIQDFTVVNRAGGFCDVFVATSEQVILLRQSSLSGSFDFVKTIASGSATKIGYLDFNGDKEKDIIFMDDFTKEVVLMTGKGNDIFDKPLRVNAINNLTDFCFGDLSGNGLPDLLLSSSSDSISVLANRSSSAITRFELFKIGVTSPVSNISIHDVNGDGKGDMLFTPTQDKGSIWATYNTVCFQPVIESFNGSSQVCSSAALRLQTDSVAGASYSWYVDGILLAGSNSLSIDVITSGSYQVKIGLSYLDCEMLSPAFPVTASNQINPATAAITGPSRVCVGDTITLSANSNQNLNYHWSGPGGFTASTASVTITNVDDSHSGKYTLYVSDNDCYSSVSGYMLLVDSSKPTYIQSSNGRNICLGDTTTLSVSSSLGDSFFWYLNGSLLSSRESVLKTSVSGTYMVSYGHGPGCNYKSMPFKLSHGNDDVRIVSKDSACVLVSADFSLNGSLSAYQVSWRIDGQTFQGFHASYAFNTPGKYRVFADITDKVNGCSSSVEKVIEVFAEPSFVLPDGGTINLCTSSSYIFRLDGDYSSIVWFDGSRDPTRAFTEPGYYPFSVYNQPGCSIDTSFTIMETDASLISLKASALRVTPGSPVTVSLFYPGDPVVELRSLFASSIIVKTDSTYEFSPVQNTTIDVLLTYGGSCVITKSITIEVENVINLVAPEFFSPNGDGVDDDWVPLGLDGYQCRIVIFDVIGNVVFKSSSFRRWNGEGLPASLIDGQVYYYVLTIESIDFLSRGSITVMR